MNRMFVKQVPQYEFEEISIEQNAWNDRFLLLVKGGKPITFELIAMPVIPIPVQEALSRGSYVDVSVTGNEDQHYLIPGGLLHS